MADIFELQLDDTDAPQVFDLQLDDTDAPQVFDLQLDDTDAPAEGEASFGSTVGAFAEGAARELISVVSPSTADRTDAVDLAQEDTLTEEVASGVGQGVAQAGVVGAFTAGGAAIGSVFGGVGAIPGAVIGGGVGLGVTFVQGVRRQLFGVEDEVKATLKKQGREATQADIELAQDRALGGILVGETVDGVFSAATAGTGKIVTKAVKGGIRGLSTQAVKKEATKQAITRLGRTKEVLRAGGIGFVGEFGAETVQTASSTAAVESVAEGEDFGDFVARSGRELTSPESLRAGLVGGISAGTVRAGAVGTGADRIIENRISRNAQEIEAELNQEVGTPETPSGSVDETPLKAGLDVLEESAAAQELGAQPDETTAKALSINEKIAAIENEDIAGNEVVFPSEEISTEQLQAIYGEEPNLIIEGREDGSTRVVHIPEAERSYEKVLREKQERLQDIDQELIEIDQLEAKRAEQIARVEKRIERQQKRVARFQQATERTQDLDQDEAAEQNFDKFERAEDRLQQLVEQRDQLLGREETARFGDLKRRRRELNEEQAALTESFAGFRELQAEERQRALNNATELSLDLETRDKQAEELAPTSGPPIADPAQDFEQATQLPEPQNESEQITRTAVEAIKDQVRRTTFNQNPDTPVQKVLRVFTRQERDPSRFSTTKVDYLRRQFLDRFRPVEAAQEFAQQATGRGELRPSQNPMTLIRLFAGKAAKLDAVLDHGMIDANEQVVTGGGVKWLLEPFAKDNPELATQQLESTIAYMLSQRIREKAQQRFQQQLPRIQNQVETAQATEQRAVDRQSPIIGQTAETQMQRAQNTIDRTQGADVAPIAGVSDPTIVEAATGRTLTEEQIAIDAINEIEQRGDFDVIKDAASRYRQWADANIQYLVDTGVISQESADTIRDNNNHYVAMTRIFEADDGSDLNQVAQASGSVGSANQLLKRFKGSAREIEDPYMSMLRTTGKVLQEGDRNRIKQALVSLVDPEQNPNADPEALASVGRKTDKKTPNSIAVINNGKQEFWEFDPDVSAQLNNIISTGRLPGWLRFLPRVLRNTITYTPAFAFRNFIRDTLHRATVSRTAQRPLRETRNYIRETMKRRGNLDVADLNRAGGGFAGYYLNNEVDYYRAMEAVLRDKGFNQSTLLLRTEDTIRNAWRRYDNFIQAFEKSTRKTEYDSAYKTAREELGYNDRDARLYAAYQSRNLIDFAVAGEFLHEINQLIPFTNAAVQGISRSLRAAKENPQRWAAKMSLYLVIPVLAERAFNAARGDEEEYDQLPAYQKDLFWNFKINETQWLRIPKPFEQGVMASSVGRALDYAAGDEKAFEGYPSSLANSLTPIEGASVVGPFRPIVEALANYDFFRQRYIIPFWEQKLDTELRDTERASGIGKAGAAVAAPILEAADAMGLRVLGGLQLDDPRIVDHLIEGTLGNVGRMATDVTGDQIREAPGSLTIRHLLGITSYSPLRNARDVNFVLSYAEQRGIGPRSKKLKRLKTSMVDYYNETDLEKKKAAYDATIEEAIFLREQIEEYGDLYFGKDPNRGSTTED